MTSHWARRRGRARARAKPDPNAPWMDDRDPTPTPTPTPAPAGGGGGGGGAPAPARGPPPHPPPGGPPPPQTPPPPPPRAGARAPAAVRRQQRFVRRHAAGVRSAPSHSHAPRYLHTSSRELPRPRRPRGTRCKHPAGADTVEMRSVVVPARCRCVTSAHISARGVLGLRAPRVSPPAAGSIVRHPSWRRTVRSLQRPHHHEQPHGPCRRLRVLKKEAGSERATACGAFPNDGWQWCSGSPRERVGAGATASAASSAPENATELSTSRPLLADAPAVVIGGGAYSYISAMDVWWAG